tara:strand:+ start:308 stop:754 length:447 start_codon:yes stop_codon:yes gene_type:complete
MNKDLLFYSNKDDYSKEIIEIINKNNIKDIFPVCIDDSKIKIPGFIKLIPTIYLSKSKELIIDEKIKEHVNGLIKKETIENDSIEAYSSDTMGNLHDIDLSKKEDSNLDFFFTENEKIDEDKVLENRAKNVDGLMKLRNSDINTFFEK